MMRSGALARPSRSRSATSRARPALSLSSDMAPLAYYQIEPARLVGPYNALVTMPKNIRLSRTRRAGLLVATAVVALAAAGQPPADPWRWLESIDGTRALTWVHEQNARTLARYAVDPLYKTLYPEALSVLDSASRVPEISQRGGYVYNLWQDKAHPRGTYRRATVESFARNSPDWQTVLDVDGLSKQEGKPWAFGGITCLSPGLRPLHPEPRPRRRRRRGGARVQRRDAPVRRRRILPPDGQEASPGSTPTRSMWARTSAKGR